MYNLANDAGIPSETITSETVSLTSERCVTICDGIGNLISVDLKTLEITRRPNKADNVISHPTKNYTAVRAKLAENPKHTTIHIYNMDTREKIVNTTVNEEVKFWNWISPKILSLVCTKGIYHINLESSGSLN